MLGAIYIGLSGMGAYSKGLQTISNNVTNLNTTGFKSTEVSFTDLFSNGGDTPPSTAEVAQEQQGYGVRFGSPMIDFGQGDLRQSDNDLDLALQGRGFFVLMSGDETQYVRTGQFAVDTNGYISQRGTERHLAVLDSSGRTVAVNVDDKRTSPPAATTKIVFADNLSSSGTEASVSDIAVYDSTGGKHVWSVLFNKSQSNLANEWDVTVKDSNGNTIGTSKLKFLGSIVDPATSTLVITDQSNAAAPLSVTLDFSSGVTSFSAGTTSTLRAGSVDGNATGALTGVTVDDKGQLKLSYSNGKSDLMGAVAIADFADPQQLVRAGEGIFRASSDVARRLLSSGAEGVGTIVSKQIEASNVDLSKEFGDLILIQRGFQASSQVVSVSNDMIQQLFGIRGQG